MASFTTTESTTVNELMAAAMTRMTKLWDEIGTSETDRESVSNSLKKKLAACVREVEEAEVAIRDGKIASIQQSCEMYKKKATMLVKATTTIDGKRENENLTDAELRTTESLNLITEEYKKVVSVHEGLLEQLHTLYITLKGKDEPFESKFETIGEILSEKREIDLREEIKKQEKEKNDRIESRQKLVSEWEELIDEMSLLPKDNTFDERMQELHKLMEDEECPQKDVEVPIGLTIIDVAAISHRVNELGEEKERRLKLITELGQQITTLWDKLGIDHKERDDFFAINEAGLGNKEIEACQSELAKLIILKKERVRPMIENERSAILDLWRKLYFSEEQKAAFEAFYVNEDMFNEEILEKHEEYNKELTEQWKEQEPIMLKIEKREKILTYPAKLKEPLKTRKDIDESTGKSYTSGAISKLNKKRAGMTQMVKKVLPKIETELVELLANWKHKYGTDIMIEGDVYLETVQESIANRENLLRKKKNAINENAMRKYSVVKVNRKTLGTR